RNSSIEKFTQAYGRLNFETELLINRPADAVTQSVSDGQIRTNFPRILRINVIFFRGESSVSRRPSGCQRALCSEHKVGRKLTVTHPASSHRILNSGNVTPGDIESRGENR